MLTVLAFLRRGPPSDPVSGWSIATFLLYFDLLEYAGPVQAGLRDPFGWTSARDYRFPEIRSLGGAVLVMGSVLYPYVYLMARTAFRLTPASYYEVAALHDRGIAFPVGLPLARPAIVAGWRWWSRATCWAGGSRAAWRRSPRRCCGSRCWRAGCWCSST